MASKNDKLPTLGKEIDASGESADKSETSTAPKNNGTTGRGNGSDSAKEPSSRKAPAEKYFRVRFHDKQREEEEDFIPLGVNGEILQVTKGEEVILPERFLEVARHAKYPVYKLDAKGGDRTITSWVQKAAFSMIGETTKAEYEKMKKSGTKIHQEALRKRKEAENS